MTTQATLASNEWAVAFLDAFPVSRGHALIVSRRHVASLFDLSPDEQAGLWSLLGPARDALLRDHSPAAFNVGVNVGAAAGQTVAHVLKPAVSLHLVRLNSVLRPLFRREWALMVAGMNQLPRAELERFLFGVERVALDSVRGPLLDLQENRCFYCDRRIATGAEVDHFLPWSRYPDDGLDNLVATHPDCNSSKRDFLAAAEHVERWRARTGVLGDDLVAIARESGWRRDDARTLAVARTLYLRLPDSVQLWQAPSRFVPLDRERIASALR